MEIKNFLEKLQEDTSIELFDRFKTKKLTNKGWVTGANLSVEIANIISDQSSNKSASLNISKKILERATESSSVEDLNKQDLEIDTSNKENGTILVHIYDEKGNRTDTMTLGKHGKNRDSYWTVVS